MAALTDIVDLGQLGLKPGGAIRFDARVAVGDFIFGGEHYKLAEDPLTINVNVTRTTSGNVITLRGETTLNGPCMRCFGDYALPLEIDHSEVHEPVLDPDLASEYIDGLDLDLAGLLRDAIGLTLPTTIASPQDEQGNCRDCEGAEERLAKLRETSEDENAQPDPRWAKLRELEL